MPTTALPTAELDYRHRGAYVCIGELMGTLQSAYTRKGRTFVTFQVNTKDGARYEVDPRATAIVCDQAKPATGIHIWHGLNRPRQKQPERHQQYQQR